MTSTPPGPHPAAPHPTPPPAPSWRRPAAPPVLAGEMPGRAIAAAVLGIVGVWPALAGSAVLALFAADLGAPGWGRVAWAVPLVQVAGAVLLLFRRTWVVLAVATVPTALVLLAQFAVSGGLLSIALLAVPATTVGLAASRPVRDWVGDRTRRPTPLPGR